MSIHIRFWDGCRILGDLDVSSDSSCWVVGPDMPDHRQTVPDIELDPFRRLVKFAGEDVTGPDIEGWGGVRE